MHRIAPSTLLKLMSQRSEDKIRDLRQYDEPGGYDANHSFKRAVATGLARSGLTGLRPAIERISVEGERSRGLGFEPILARRLKTLGSEFFTTPKATWRSPLGTFSVEFQPEVGVVKAERLLLMLYINQKTSPTRTSAGALILLARRALGDALSENDNLAVLDVARDTLFRAVNNTAAALLEKEVTDLDQWFSGRVR